MTQNSKNEKKEKAVIVTQSEMENAFRSHKGIWGAYKSNPNHTHKMVLFYAVECGLKAYYMREKKFEFSSAAADNEMSASAFSHRLNDLLKKLNIAGDIPGITKNVGKPINSQHLHAAWRYGKKLDEQEETLCIQSLTKILNDIKMKLALPGGIL
ncbi:MAG: hypothetical protein MUF15_21620 [Acidobacteria bacterium]|jgi:hypothetical protein|nr:hypothetical protein [Acidobacteriota bacterium]